MQLRRHTRWKFTQTFYFLSKEFIINLGHIGAMRLQILREQNVWKRSKLIGTSARCRLMLMEILAIDQDCLISYLNLYFDEIAEIILLSTFYLSRLFKILDNSRIPSFLISQIRILSRVSYRSRPRSYYKPSILHACRSIRFTLSLVSSPRISFRIVSFDLKLLVRPLLNFLYSCETRVTNVHC